MLKVSRSLKQTHVVVYDVGKSYMFMSMSFHLLKVKNTWACHLQVMKNIQAHHQNLRWERNPNLHHQKTLMI